MNRYHIVFRVSITLLYIYTSCSAVTQQASFQNTESETFTLPSWTDTYSPDLPPLSYWLVQYWSDTGTEHCTVASDKKTITLELHKNRPAAVLASPVTRHTAGNAVFFRPAGCIYPYGKVLSWQDGFAAHILAVLYTASGQNTASGSFCTFFNWQRFIDTIREKEASSITDIAEAADAGTAGAAYYNPWNLDQSRILSAITKRKFTVYPLYPPPAAVLKNTAENSSELLSRYIPENKEIQLTGFLSIAATPGAVTEFLYRKDRVAVYTANDAKEISLAISALPLYTGDQ